MRAKHALSRILSVFAVLFVIGGSPGGYAQTFPSKPLTFVMPSPPGSGVEAAFRAMAEEVGNQLGKPMIFENRPGAAGRLGLRAVAAAPGDGHIVAMATNATLVVQPIAMDNYSIEVGRDYSPVIIATKNFLALYANASLPFRTVADVIAYARANPGKLNVASVQVGGTSHLAIEQLKLLSKVDLFHVAYAGSSKATPDLVAGRVQLMFAGGNLKPLVDSGKLVALATSGEERWFQFPDVPTIEEALKNGFNTTIYLMIVAPPKVPAADLLALNTAFNASIRAPKTIEAVRKVGMVPAGGTQEQVLALLKSEHARWEPVIRKAGIKLKN